MINLIAKQCKKCHAWKPPVEFHNDKQRKDGKYPQCKDCHYDYMRRRYHNQPGVSEANKKRARLFNATNEGKKSAREKSNKFYSSVIGRAKTLLKGINDRQPDNTVTLDHIVSLIEKEYCPITGIKFDLRARVYQEATGRNKNPNAPSVDKIVPSLGYTNDNVRVVIWQYNMMKGELSDLEVNLICLTILRKIKWI